MDLIELPVNKIKPYEKNPRKNDGAVESVAESIKQCGYIAPIIVDEENVILAGHTRLKALKKLGYKKVPVVIKEGLSEEQKRKYRLLDNKTNELAEWDFDLLGNELEGLDFGGLELGWGVDSEDDAEETEEEAYERKKQEFRERMERGELSEDSDEYQEFLQKFETKKTTDDCYTPPNVYEVVADYVADHYKVKKVDFVRPFYPGGDYQKEKYHPSSVVVDNPPFSIISEICRWYDDRGIKFFMFAPTLTILGIRSAQKVVVGNSIVYENGASVTTSFVTNMDEYEIRSAPDLYERLEEANKANLRAMKKELPTYYYPLECVRQTDIAKLSKYGQFYGVRKESCRRISELDAQKEYKKGIFGSGYLISERAAAERAAAERAAAERAAAERAAAERAAATTWELSDREKEIIKSLN